MNVFMVDLHGMGQWYDQMDGKMAGMREGLAKIESWNQKLDIQVSRVIIGLL